MKTDPNGAGWAIDPGSPLTRAKRFLADQRAVAAIEFAFMVPLLLCLYLGSMELSQAIETNKKVGRTASMIADLVTQETVVTKAVLANVMGIGAATLKPYNRSQPTIQVTAIRIDSAAGSQPTEVWWRRMRPNGTTEGGTSASNSGNPTLPTALNTPGTFYIRVTADMQYQPVLTYNASSAEMFGISRFVKGGFPMSESYFLRPRRSDAITCSDC